MSVWFWLTSVLLRVTSTCIQGELVVNTVEDPGISKLGGAVPAGKFLGLGFVLMPHHTYPTVFLVRIVNKIHIVNIVWKYMHMLHNQNKKIKTNPQKVSNRGLCAWRAGPGFALSLQYVWLY